MPRPRGITKISNEYAEAFGEELYSNTPKAVFAAVAWSYMSMGGDFPEQGISGFIQEWKILFQNGIVKQPPPNLKDAQIH